MRGRIALVCWCGGVLVRMYLLTPLTCPGKSACSQSATPR